MIKILSTKILPPRLKKIIEAHGMSLKDYNAINIVFEKFAIDLSFDHYIFTSQNAVRSFLRAYDNLPLPEKRKEALSKTAFCVGGKTQGLLEENGLKVSKMAKNSLELAENITKMAKKSTFLFICGNRRREDLPRILSENTIRYKEVIGYRTVDNPQRLEDGFDAILFFSPSGVQSFSSVNEMNASTAFCIGETTAGEARKHTADVVVSPVQSIESVLNSTIDYFTNRS